MNPLAGIQRMQLDERQATIDNFAQGGILCPQIAHLADQVAHDVARLAGAVDVRCPCHFKLRAELANHAQAAAEFSASGKRRNLDAEPVADAADHIAQRAGGAGGEQGLLDGGDAVHLAKIDQRLGQIGQAVGGGLIACLGGGDGDGEIRLRLGESLRLVEHAAGQAFHGADDAFRRPLPAIDQLLLRAALLFGGPGGGLLRDSGILRHPDLLLRGAELLVFQRRQHIGAPGGEGGGGLPARLHQLDVEIALLGGDGARPFGGGLDGGRGGRCRRFLVLQCEYLTHDRLRCGVGRRSELLVALDLLLRGLFLQDVELRLPLKALRHEGGELVGGFFLRGELGVVRFFLGGNTGIGKLLVEGIHGGGGVDHFDQ